MSTNDKSPNSDRSYLHSSMHMINISQFYCPGGVVRRMRYVTEQGCRPKSLRGVTEGGGWVKMAIFSVTYLLNHPLHCSHPMIWSHLNFLFGLSKIGTSEASNRQHFLDIFSPNILCVNNYPSWSYNTSLINIQ